MKKILILANDVTTIVQFRKELIKALVDAGNQVLVSIPKQITKISRTRIKLMNTRFLLILLAQISENDMKPKRQVNANRPKQSEIIKVTMLLNAVHGVSSSTEARYLGSFPNSNQAAELSVSHTLPIKRTMDQ